MRFYPPKLLRNHRVCRRSGSTAEHDNAAESTPVSENSTAQNEVYAFIRNRNTGDNLPRITEVEMLERVAMTREEDMVALISDFQRRGDSLATGGHHDPQPCSPPPAKDEAIQKLPRVRVLPSDKERAKDDTSTCGICCERLLNGFIVCRLPCGHEYHFNCVIPWLSRVCTCPVCRYELPTSDPAYEVGREQRMKDRKIVSCSCYPPCHHTCFFKPPMTCQLVNQEGEGKQEENYLTT